MGGFVEDSFKFTVKISFWYIFMQIVKYGTPILSALGMYQYYHILYAIFCKRFYRYRRTVILDVDENFLL